MSQDPEFIDWCEQHLRFTLGEEVRAATVAQCRGGEGARHLHLVEQISKNMGTVSSRGYKHSPQQSLAPPGRGAAQRMTTKSEGASIPKTMSPL